MLKKGERKMDDKERIIELENELKRQKDLFESILFDIMELYEIDKSRVKNEGKLK